MTRVPNPQQAAAIDARGVVFVAAGAGTGKTSVLVERFKRAVVDEGLDVESVLVITYTERAAAELRMRIRERLVDCGRADLSRALDGAWISTIHGFCRRLLATHALTAGIDPAFRVLPEAQARILQGEAFTDALERFCSEGEPERLSLLATYGARRLRAMLVSVYETLRSAGRQLVLEPGAVADLATELAAVRREAADLLADPKVTEAQAKQAQRALDIIDRSSLAENVLELEECKPRGVSAGAFNDARASAVAAAYEELAGRDRELLQELLLTFATSYATAKDKESALDFEDLQLRARDLLRDNPGVREPERQRFRSVMVDEFQDTNRLQTEVIDLLVAPEHGGSGAPDLFYVGDEFQSIYGFRHADVAVFRERRAAAPTVLPLTFNYRSRPEVLGAVNQLFTPAFGDGYQPLEAAGGELAEPLRNAVELLVTDKSAFEGGSSQWRRSEAQAVARRIRELVDAGLATAGEVVVLFAAGTEADWFEEELQAVGLPTLRAAGRSYFGQQQVVDLVSYLQLLQNRYDDEALLTVLASPFVGVSNDALVLIRAAAVRQPLFKGIERTVPEQLSDTDRRLLLAFRQRYDRLVSAAARGSLEQLCERILTEHDYDLAVLARDDGRRRYANLRKLARLARQFEELRGPDLEGFLRFVREQEAVNARELDAVSEEEGADAVRLLTIHAAKGLEFKVVVVADAGRERPATSDILCLSDGRFGFKVAHPVTGKRMGTESYGHVKESKDEAERAERLRLYYVAMTRAMERLIVSGSFDPADQREDQTAIRWVIDQLELREEISRAGDGPTELRRGGATVVLHVDRGSPERAPGAIEPVRKVESVAGSGGVPEPGQLALFEGQGNVLPWRAPRLRPLETVPAPPLGRVGRLSFSTLSLFERCSYRFYAERIVGMRPTPFASVDDAREEALGDALQAVPEETLDDALHVLEGALDDALHAAPEETPADAICAVPEEPQGDALHATEMGDAVHRLLELVDLAAPEMPTGWDAVVRGWYPRITELELERAGALTRAYVESPLARRIAGLAGARPERPFAFTVGDVLLNGRLDVLWAAGDTALVLDYKTNALLDRDPATIVDHEYRGQRNVYALACLRAGYREVEVVYQFLEAPDELVTETFTDADAPRLEHELTVVANRIAGADFRPTPSAFACSGCPALDVVCAGTRLAAVAS